MIPVCYRGVHIMIVPVSYGGDYVTFIPTMNEASISIVPGREGGVYIAIITVRYVCVCIAFFQWVWFAYIAILLVIYGSDCMAIIPFTYRRVYIDNTIVRFWGDIYSRYTSLACRRLYGHYTAELTRSNSAVLCHSVACSIWPLKISVEA
jgi:hypothetical protein